MRYILLLSVLLISISIEAQNTELTTFILVRHAEKANDGTRNPDLSPEGNLRAENLAKLLEDSNPAVILSTQYKRTSNTVAPLSKSLNLNVKFYDPRDQSFLDKIILEYQGETIVIVGHSNTTPALVNQLIGKDKYQTFDEHEYGNIFVVTTKSIGNGKEVILKY